MSLFDSASLIVTPNGVKEGKLYSVKPIDGSGDLNVVRATTATRVNSDGLIESVANNVPRLYYTNGSCPSIFVEPQRTNLVLRSEELDNATWGKTRCSVLPNQTNAPNNELVADYIQQQTASFSGGFVFQSFSGITIGQSYVFSVFAKKNGKNFIALRPNLAGSDFTWFDLNNGTIGVTGASHTPKIEAFNDGWYRCSVKFNAVNASGTNNIYIYDNDGEYSVTDSGGVFVWGVQLEAGSNATSYIPTVTSAVTRNADVISKTGISSLIGQTEGTLYADVNIDNFVNGSIITIDSGTSANFIQIFKNSTKDIRVRIRSGSGALPFIIISPLISSGRHKIALNYTNGDYALYIDGIKVGVSTNSTNYPILSITSFILSATNYGELNDSYNSVAIWKTRLTDQECINLTTI